MIAAITAGVLVMSGSVHAADPERAPVVENDSTAALQPEAGAWGPVAAPVSPEIVELRDRRRKAERLAIGGYVVTGVGALVCLLSLPVLITARMASKQQDNFFQEADDPEDVRAKRRMGLGMLGAGLGVAAIGGTLIGVGLSRRNRHTRELEELSRPRPAAAVTPTATSHGGGVALVGRF